MSAAVCALLPSVSENARNSASTAISSATLLLMVVAVGIAVSAAAVLVMLDLVFDFVLHRMHTVAHVRIPHQSDVLMSPLAGAVYHARGWALR